MEFRSLQDITSAVIQKLVDDEAGEDRFIEYKAALPLASDGEKKEFLADICAFANTSGGYLFFGIEEKRDDNGKTTGVPSNATGIEVPNTDEMTRRIDETIRSGLARVLSGVQIKWVEGFEKGPVLILHIPKSWNAPHMVTFKGTSRFWGRSNASKFQMGVDDIQKAFLAPDQLFNTLREFRFTRLGKIETNEGPCVLNDQPKMVLHLVPLNFQNPARALSAAELFSNTAKFPPLVHNGWSGRYNFDGYLSYWQTDAKLGVLGYTQAFRNGIIEGVDAFHIREDKSRGKVLYSVTYEETILARTADYLRTMRELGVELPIVAMVSFLNVKGFRLGVGAMRLWQEADAIDREQLIIPEVLIESFDAKLNSVFRPVFDFVWNACGFDKCYDYDEAGNWKRT